MLVGVVKKAVIDFSKCVSGDVLIFKKKYFFFLSTYCIQVPLSNRKIIHDGHDTSLYM